MHSVAIVVLVASIAFVGATPGFLQQAAPVAIAQPVCSCPPPQVQVVEKIIRVPEIRTVTNVQHVKVPVVQRVEVPVERIVEKVVVQKVHVPVDRIVDRIVEKRIEVPVVQRVEVPVPVDRIVEKVVYKDVVRNVPVVQVVEKQVPVVKYIEKPCIAVQPAPQLLVSQGVGWSRK